MRSSKGEYSPASFDRALQEWKAALVAFALLSGLRFCKVHSEIGQLDALCGYADISRSRTDPTDEFVVLLLWPPSERIHGFQDRRFNARFCEIVLRPVGIFEDVVEDGGAQLEHGRIRAKDLRNVKRVSQVKLRRILPTMVLERQGGDVDRVDEQVRSSLSVDLSRLPPVPLCIQSYSG